MKAIQVHRFGGPEVLEVQEVPTPKPAPGQILVHVHAAGVNPYDTYMRAGTYAVKPPLPYTPGSDAAGTVEAVGEGVKKAKPGDRVYTAKTLTGAYAEYTLVDESQAYPLPDKISFAQGAGLWVPYGTAYTALFHHGHARPAETLLIHGASGGVGLAAVQYARALGMTVLGTAGSQRGLDLIKKEGAHAAFDHTKPEHADEIMKFTGGRGVDVILEMIANVNLATDMKLMAIRGRTVVIGNRGEITVNPRDLMARRASVCGFTLWAVTETEAAEIHAAIAAGLENGTLRPIVGKEVPLKDAAIAHQDVLAPGAFGKIALIA
ncbi:MAG TPA: NADPH:quinone reductase [Candidatus Acidoferrales bacterium]|jgi:NADPH2:quinone reductase|nr:NADPH:quinone reductase [Candidatus Acidoferrales bacterium]